MCLTLRDGGVVVAVAVAVFDLRCGSLAIGPAVLACDGMGGMLCLHDFSEVGDDPAAYLDGSRVGN